jgi:hypothetical protein
MIAADGGGSSFGKRKKKKECRKIVGARDM